MDLISFEARISDSNELDFYSDPEVEDLDFEDLDLDVSDASDRKTLLD